MRGPATVNRSYKDFVEYLTPNIADTLSVKRRDISFPTIQFEYGDAHPESDKFPNHKLIHVSPDPNAPTQGTVWYYAADRSDQDDYNYKIEFPYAGVPTYPRITRTYLYPRDGYTPVAKGTLDPKAASAGSGSLFATARLIGEVQQRTGDEKFDSLYVIVQRIYDTLPSAPQQDAFNFEIEFPYSSDVNFPRIIRTYTLSRDDVDLFVESGDTGETDSVYTDAVLISQKIKRFDDPTLDSLYVQVVRVYDTIPDLTDSGDVDILKTFGFSVDRPHGGSAYLRLIWRFPIQASAYSAATDLSACPIAGYTSLVLIDEDLQDDPSNNETAVITRIYDKLPGPTLRTLQERRNAVVPPQFVSKTNITQSQEREGSGSLDATWGLPTTGSGAILSSQRGPDGASIIVKTDGRVQTKQEISSLSGWEMDQETGLLMPFTQEVIPAGGSGSPVNGSGTYAEVRPYNPFYSIKTTRKATTLTNQRTYSNVVNYTWPPILNALVFSTITATSADGVDYTERVRYHADITEAYSGPCSATITEQWFATTQSLPSLTQMQPERIVWDMIFSQGSLPATLHAEITIAETTGTTHPKYPLQVSSVTFAATSFTDWPSSIVASLTQQPYRGGFKVTQVTVNKPV